MAFLKGFLEISRLVSRENEEHKNRNNDLYCCVYFTQNFLTPLIQNYSISQLKVQMHLWNLQISLRINHPLLALFEVHWFLQHFPSLYLHYNHKEELSLLTLNIISFLSALLILHTWQTTYNFSYLFQTPLKIFWVVIRWPLANQLHRNLTSSGLVLRQLRREIPMFLLLLLPNMKLTYF